MSVAAATSPAASHPIGLIVTDDLRRNRLTVFFRLILAIPHFIWLSLWGFVVEVILLFAWLIAVFAGRLPDGLHNFLASFLRYSTRVNAYVLLLADPWPPFTSDRSYPVDVRIDPAQPQSRLTIFFRIILAIPALILTYVFRLVNNIVAFLGWFYALATGRMSPGMRDLSAWLFRYETQTFAYIFLLTGRYPSLSGTPTA
jgi:hypothetical protein